jgi:hypothetical protein
VTASAARRVICRTVPPCHVCHWHPGSGPATDARTPADARHDQTRTGETASQQIITAHRGSSQTRAGPRAPASSSHLASVRGQSRFPRHQSLALLGRLPDEGDRLRSSPVLALAGRLTCEAGLSSHGCHYSPLVWLWRKTVSGFPPTSGRTLGQSGGKVEARSRASWSLQGKRVNRQR